MATYNNNNNNKTSRAKQEPSMAYIAFDHHEAARNEATKSCRGRKPHNKATTPQKKKPQRGMGVAQLELLRIQESLNKMNEKSPLDSHHCFPNHFASNEPIPSVPVLLGAASYGVPVLGGGGLLGFDPSVMFQRVGNGGGSGHINPDLRLAQVGTSMSLVETSNELPSMQKIQSHWAAAPERCDICLKMKKRFNGQNSGFNVGKEMYAEICPINGYDITGFNQQHNMMNFDGRISSFGAREARSASCASHHLNHEAVEAVAIHGNGNARERNVLMEYEFFPGKGSRSTSSKEMESTTAEASVAVAGEASSFGSTAYSVNAASNSIDLSLKLSY